MKYSKVSSDPSAAEGKKTKPLLGSADKRCAEEEDEEVLDDHPVVSSARADADAVADDADDVHDDGGAAVADVRQSTLPRRFFCAVRSVFGASQSV
eukprot:m51a1_g3372 hypothetical protein (96) ;mRNA; f:462285-462572